MADEWEDMMTKIETATPSEETSRRVLERTRVVVANGSRGRRRTPALALVIGAAAAAAAVWFVTVLAHEDQRTPTPEPVSRTTALAAMQPPAFTRETGATSYFVPPTHKDPGPTASRYVVHEWGVIGLDVVGADEIRAALKADLPDFIRRVAPETGARFFIPPTHKPVLYFYPDAHERFYPDVKVSIPGGKILYFWPPTSASETELFYRHNVFWNRGIDPANARPVPDGHWIEKARDTDAAWLQVTVIEKGKKPLVSETERFIFYDGQVPYVGPLLMESTNGRLAVRHVGKEPLADVMLIETAGGETRIDHVALLGGGERRELAPRPVEDAEALLVERLTAAGLFEKEARGMASIWREDFFERDGRWLLWRLDSATIDALMPLYLKPAPVDTKRVHLVFSPVLPDISSKVALLVDELDGDEFEAALRALRSMGTPVCAHLVAFEAHENATIRGRVIALLDEIGRPR